MKKQNIIQKEQEFTKIISNYPYKKNDYYVIYYKKNKTENNRYGISVPKKTGKAHIRNKIKRRLKNIIDLNEKKMHKPYDYVIIIRKRLLELNYKEMEINFMTLLEEIGDKNESEEKK